MKKLLFLVVCLLGHALMGNAQGRRLEVLFLGDAGHHKPVERVPFLMAALGPKDINVTYEDKTGALTLEHLRKFDALVVYANIDTASPALEKAILTYVEEGGAYVPVHCATFCFRNSDPLLKLAGGRFWRHTMDSISIDHKQPQHPILSGLKPFKVFDETYLHEKLAGDIDVLATRKIMADQSKDKPGVAEEPYVWTKTQGKGKVFYTALGHDQNTWANEGFLDLLHRGIMWAVNDKAKEALKALNPKPLEFVEAKLPNYEQRPGVQMKQLALSPEESMKHIQIPVDFKLELFAAEPNVQHPIAMTWDERGRLFVLVTKDYPNERKPEGGSDFILLCEDTNADGKADKFTKWAEGLSIPTGMVFANDGLVVAQAPDMLHLRDTDGDNKADQKKVLFSGFGTFDTHAGPSNLHYGFDNWIWGCVGYSGFYGKLPQTDSLKFGQAFFRFKADGSKMEWMTNTSNNTWGFAFNENNEVFGSTANNSHGWHMAIPNRYFNSGQNIENGSRSTDTHRDMKPITGKVRQVDAFGGFTAAAGHNFYTARAFPKKYWNQMAFVAEPTGHVLHQNLMQKDGTTFNDREAFNLMAGADEWFSPVFAEVGPDGAVWVADWYSYIIQHNPVPQGFKNGDGNAYETDLRDFTHGRIYRVSYDKAPKYDAISLSKTDLNGLLRGLQSDNLFWRLQAQRLLIERNQKDVVPALKQILRQAKDDLIGVNGVAINALWTLNGLGAADNTDIDFALKHPNAAVRTNALKMLPETAASTAKIMKFALLNDPEPTVVMNSLLVLSKSPLDAAAKQTVMAKLKSTNAVADRWLADAFACVLTANKAELMQQLLKSTPQSKKAVAAMPGMDHAQHHMNHGTGMENLAEKLDLRVKAVKLIPEKPAARERLVYKIEVENASKEDYPVGQLVKADVFFSGQGISSENTSRNYKDGIKAGQSILLERNNNGPWSGDLALSSDIPGDYELKIVLDPKNEVLESNEKNNVFVQKVTFSAPPSVETFALQRAMRSYASIAKPDAVVDLIKKVATDETRKNIAFKAIQEGWNFKAKNVELSSANQNYLKSLPLKDQNSLEKLMKAWNLATTPADGVVARQVKIKAVREAMKYDLTNFEVKAGEEIELIFENPDAMQHNLVIVKPQSMEKVGNAADKMMMDEKGAEKNYVPALAEVLFATPLVNPDQTFSLRFKAPANAGNYPYVCTFPGHWRLMNGTMKVVK